MSTLPRPGDPSALYVFDLACWMHRFYRTVGGRAAHAFIEFVGKILRMQRPAYCAICVDLPWPTFRAKLYPKREDGTGYKAQREPPDPTLLERMRWAYEMLEDVHGIKIYAERGFEADDLIAALVARAKEDGLKVVLVALDKDLMQLVDEDVVMWDGKQNVVGIPEVIQKFDVRPTQLRDYLAIVGDSADNIPGVRGAGPKAAVEILHEFGNLDEALACATAHYDRPFFQQRPRYRELLKADPQMVKLSQKLVTLADWADIEYDLNELRFAS